MSDKFCPDVEVKENEQNAAEVGVMVTKMLDALYDSVFDAHKGMLADEVVLELYEKKLDEFLKIKDLGRYLYIVASHYQFGENSRGITYEVDFEKALNLFTAAANRGYMMAQYCLANYYEHCVMGLEQDFDKAAYWYKKAAENGDKESVECLERVRAKKAGKY